MALSKIDISKAGITGTLAAANGGTGATSYSPGKVLQVLNTRNVTATNTSSTSYVDAGISQAITPSSTSNKILVLYTFGQSGTGASARDGYCTLLRDTTNLGSGGADNSAFTVKKGNASANDYDLGDSIIYLDSPSSTSSLTYKIPVKVSNADMTYNHNGDGSNDAEQSLTVMEISA